MSSPGPLVVGVALFFGRSSTQLADFIRRTAELIAIIVSLVVFRILNKNVTPDLAQKEKLERTANLFVGAAMSISGAAIIFVALSSPAMERGNVIPGLIIAGLGTVVNSWFFLRYSRLNREKPDAILAVQSKLYLAKSLVDACVTTALAVITVAPDAPATFYVDLGGSIIVGAYLIMNGIITIRGKSTESVHNKHMDIKNSMIEKDLRAMGIIMRIIPRIFFTETGLRLLSKMPNKMGKNIKSDNLQVEEKWITRKDGSKIRICIFKPLEPVENAPGFLWLHGGGYALGSPEQAAQTANRLNEASKCVVIAPDYRLSVEAPYPAALEDCYQTLSWMKSHAKDLGIRDDQLMVGGDSAGGGLTAALTLYARDKGEVAIAFQMPLYPMLDDRMTSSSSRDNNAPVWNSRSNYNCWKLYLGDLFGSANVPYYAAPSRAKDYSNLPPAATFVGELEPFRDEVIQYVENLRQAGVPVNFQVYKGCYHAFEQVCPKAEISQRAFTFIKNSFKYATENYFAKQKIG